MFLHGFLLILLWYMAKKSSGLHDCRDFRTEGPNFLVTDIRISGCQEIPCPLKRNENISMEVDFTAHEYLQDTKFQILPFVNKTQYPDFEIDIIGSTAKRSFSCTDDVIKNDACTSAKKGDKVNFEYKNYKIKYYDDEPWPLDEINGSIYFIIIDKLNRNLQNKTYVSCEFIPVKYIY